MNRPDQVEERINDLASMISSAQSQYRQMKNEVIESERQIKQTHDQIQKVTNQTRKFALFIKKEKHRDEEDQISNVLIKDRQERLKLELENLTEKKKTDEKRLKQELIQ